MFFSLTISESVFEKIAKDQNLIQTFATFASSLTKLLKQACNDDKKFKMRFEEEAGNWTFKITEISFKEILHLALPNFSAKDKDKALIKLYKDLEKECISLRAKVAEQNVTIDELKRKSNFLVFNLRKYEYQIKH